MKQILGIGSGGGLGLAKEAADDCEGIGPGPWTESSSIAKQKKKSRKSDKTQACEEKRCF